MFNVGKRCYVNVKRFHVGFKWFQMLTLAPVVQKCCVQGLHIIWPITGQGRCVVAGGLHSSHSSLLSFSGPSSYSPYISCTWSICLAWQGRNKTFKTETESMQWLKLSSTNCIIKHPHPHEAYIIQSQLSLPLLPPLSFLLSLSIRQTWRSLWSMCSRGTLKRFQGSWTKA